MINSLWISKTGMEAQQTQLDVISNNLANVGTTGFKRASVQFEDLMYQNLRQVGANNTEQNQLPTGLQVGLGVRTAATSRAFTQGTVQSTGKEFDVAIQGAGFFQVATTATPSGFAYTRDGTFTLNSSGILTTSGGLPVVGVSPITAPGAKVTIEPDGKVSYTTGAGTASVPAGQIVMANFTNPPGLEPMGGNLFAESAASGTPQTGNPKSNGLGEVLQGSLEASNVNIVQELVTMIQTQRAYEMNSKAIQTTDQMLQKLTQL